MKRMVRRVMETAVPVLGIMIILSSVLLNPDVNVQLHVTVLLFGVLILLTEPPWKLTQALLPNERVALALREEVDRFLELMRSPSRPPPNATKARNKASSFETLWRRCTLQGTV